MNKVLYNDKVLYNLEKLGQLNKAAEGLLNRIKADCLMLEQDIKTLNRSNIRIKMLINGWKADKKPE